MGAPEAGTDYPGSDHFYMDVLRIVRDNVLSWGEDEDTAEEIAQKIAVDQWNRRRQGRPCWNPTRPLESYLAAAAWRALGIHKRTTQRRKQAHSRYEEAHAHDASLPAAHGGVVARDLVQVVRAALSVMTEERRTTFLAVREEGLSYAEAAARRGITERTVRNLVYRASCTLRDAVLDHEDKIND